MDNAMFPGGGIFPEDMTQVCTLCGMLFNNALALQRHMQLHILSASGTVPNITVPMLGTQPQADPAMVIPSAANILDLMAGGLGQHVIASTVNNPLLAPQTIFSVPNTSGLPPHLLSPGLTTTGLPTISQPTPPAPPSRPVKEKAPRSSKQSGGAAARSGNRRSSSAAKSHNEPSTYLSNFPKDIAPKMADQTAAAPPAAKTTTGPGPGPPQATVGTASKDAFPVSTTHFDPLEALILTSPTKLHVPLGGSTTSPPDMLGGAGGKEQQKIFQPFSTARDNQTSVLQIPKTFAPSFTAENLISPGKTGSSKTPDFDVLSTPQKIFLGSTENLFSLVSTLSHTPTSDVRHFGMNQDASTSLSTDSQAYKLSLQDDKDLLKTQFYPSIIDQVNISPKTSQHSRKKDTESASKLHSVPPTMTSLDLSRSSTPESKSRGNLPGDFLPSRVSSPKISPALPTDVDSADVAALPTKPTTYGASSDGLPTAGVAAAVPKSFSSAQTSNSGTSSAALPAPPLDIAVNPLGTGYFNALTSKLIDPTFSIGPDFNKSTSTSFGAADDPLKAKSYFENGILINQDYDKISDTNDEDDLERLIEDIDPKNDNIDTKGISEIEELLNEFNDKHPDDMKKTHVKAVDDFLNDVLGEAAKPMVENSNKSSDDIFPDAIELNQNAISELLEKEMEIIDLETKEVEKSRLVCVDTEPGGGIPDFDQYLVPSSSSISPVPILTTTATSTSVVVTTASTSTVTTAAVVTTSAEPKHPTPPKLATDGIAGADKPKTSDEPADFEMPRVGKLMKIRKYVEIQKQREQTAEKQVEVKVHEKKDPPIEDKPQTILVQVSKRKKIEYGPYINRQSLLEGKPKAAVETTTTTSPTKQPTFRPKPKPSTPTRRTFNLRERRSRPDFATLAGKTADGKKGEEKDKAKTTPDKGNKSDEVVEEDADQKESVGSDGIEKLASGEKDEGKIVTRNKDKDKKELEKGKGVGGAVDKKKSAVGKTGAKGGEKATADSAAAESAGDKNDDKPALRTRSAKAEGETADGGAKNLRKRATRNTPESEAKSKTRKTVGAESEEKTTRSSRSKQKGGDKNEIKRCSVNLGEKYNEKKAKKQAGKEAKGTAKSAKDNVNDSKIIGEDGKTVEVEEGLNDSEVAANVKGTRGSGLFERMLNEGDTPLEMTVDEIDDEAQNSDVELGDGDELSKDSESAEVMEETKTCDSETRADAFQEKMHQHTVISISTGKDKKVTLKLKLGPGFHRSSKDYVSAPKKRKVAHSNKTNVTTGQDLMANAVESMETNEPTDNVNQQKHSSFSDLKQGDNVLDMKEINDSEIQTKVGTENNFFNIQGVETQTRAVSDATRAMVSAGLSESAEKQSDESGAEVKSKGGKSKASVENEFQRLVDEAMAAVKNAQNDGEGSGKKEGYVNLRKRLNESVKYNVDDSDEEVEKRPTIATTEHLVAKSQKSLGGSKSVSKSVNTGKVGPSKVSSMMQQELNKLQAKKDLDVYDFTDTEMSDHEDAPTGVPKKMGFKPKYVSNLNKAGGLTQKKLPFVSTPLREVESTEDISISMGDDVDGATVEKEEVDNQSEPGSEASYGAKTVEPLRIKLTKIKPFKEKKHKHKKKKKKRDRSKEKERGEVVEAAVEDDVFKTEGDVLETVTKTEDIGVSDVGAAVDLGDCAIDDTKVKVLVEDLQSVESAGLDTTSNEGDEDGLDGNGVAGKNKKSKVKEKKHICEYCNVGFSQKCDLRRHTMIHTGERPWPCEICDKKFQRKTDLAKHTRIHTGEKPYACEFCDKRVSDKSQLNVHRRLHTGDRPYQCTKCGKRCITSSELSRHKAVHCSEKVHQCDLCKKTFLIKESLGMHMKLHYRSKGRAYKCHTCTIGFDKQAALDSHHCVDPLLSNFVCFECYEEFTDEMLYTDHVKTHDLGVLACNVCTVIFVDKHSLETHLCNLGVEKPRQIQCDICDMEFQEQDVYTQHMAIHDNDVGDFMCHECSELFTVRRDLKEHTKRHGPLVTPSSTNAFQEAPEVGTRPSHNSVADTGDTTINANSVFGDLLESMCDKSAFPNTSISMSTASLPTVNTSLPNAYTGIPTVNTSLSTTRTGLPTDNISLLNTYTGVPTVNTSIPTTKTSLPTSNTNILMDIKQEIHDEDDDPIANLLQGAPVNLNKPTGMTSKFTADALPFTQHTDLGSNAPGSSSTVPELGLGLALPPGLIKSESQEMVPKPRASVISGTFNVENESRKLVTDNDASLSALNSLSNVPLTTMNNGLRIGIPQMASSRQSLGAGIGSLGHSVSSERHTQLGSNIGASKSASIGGSGHQTGASRAFDASDFTNINSPDFSSLTEDDDLSPVNAFASTKDSNAGFRRKILTSDMPSQVVPQNKQVSSIRGQGQQPSFKHGSRDNRMYGAPDTLNKKTTSAAHTTPGKSSTSLHNSSSKTQKSSNVSRAASNTGTSSLLGSLNVGALGGGGSHSVSSLLGAGLPPASTSAQGPLGPGIVDTLNKASAQFGANKWPADMQMNAADYVNSLLSKLSSSGSDGKQAFPAQGYIENLDTKSQQARKGTNIRDGAGATNIHSVLDALKGNGTESRLRTELRKSSESSQHNRSHPSLKTTPSVTVSSHLSSSSNLAGRRGNAGPPTTTRQDQQQQCSRPSPVSSQIPPPTTSRQTPQFQYKSDLPMFAQSYQSSFPSGVPSCISSSTPPSSAAIDLSNISAMASSNPRQPGGADGSKRPSSGMLGAFLAAQQPLQNTYFYNMDDHLKD